MHELRLYKHQKVAVQTDSASCVMAVLVNILPKWQISFLGINLLVPGLCQKTDIFLEELVFSICPKTYRHNIKYVDL